uniref:Uncharacterized protein n=1 Tax=Meloidogyne hapla TaxID=6305 RepID=A0A1I8BG15_MELHA
MSDSDIDVVNISESDVETGPTKSKKCRRSYSIKQKLEPEGPIPTETERLRKSRTDNDFLELIDLVEEIDLMQDKENGILSDDSLEF